MSCSGRGASTRRSPASAALHDVDFDLRAGEVHGLVGANGAGKSTLVKVFTGADDADAGRVEALGREVRGGDPRARRRAGIAAIYQELMIVPELPAADNVFLGRPQRRGPFVSRSQTRRAFTRMTARLGLTIDPDARAASLSVADRQMLELMRALAAEHRILIMDEPTASLGPAERERLYETIRGLREEGVATIFVSHNLGEVLALCDRISVMRDGELVATEPVERWTKERLVTAMLGHVPAKPPPQRRRIGEQDVLRVEGLSVPGVLDDISFTLRRGEILGARRARRAPVAPSSCGRSPAPTAARDGRLFVAGRERPWPRTVRGALALGIALAPEERRSQGLVLSLSAAANVCLPDMRTVASGPVAARAQATRARRGDHAPARLRRAPAPRASRAPSPAATSRSSSSASGCTGGPRCS